MRILAPAILLLITLAACALLAAHVRPALAYGTSYSKAEIDAAKKSIALSVLGQAQMALGDLMWMKSIEYLHNGVAYRMPTNREKAQGYVERDSQNTPIGLDHPEGVSMALEEKRDWRGVIGELHRLVVPYQKQHAHSDPVELIPWYQLAIKLNPHLERLYTMGAFFMADFAREPEEALELLEAGAAANPWSFEIFGALGRLQFDYFEQQYEISIVNLEKAVDMGMRERERLRKAQEPMDNYQKQMLEESFLFLAKAYTQVGRYDEAIAVAEKGFEITNYNLLRVQERIARKRRDGEPLDEQEQKNATPAQARSQTEVQRGIKEQ